MRKLRSFCTAFAVTMCVLGLGVGLFVVGYNSRRLSEGENTGAAYRLESGQLLLTDAKGNRVKLAPVEEQRMTAPLVPAPARVTLHFLRGIAAAVDTLAEKLQA